MNPDAGTDEALAARVQNGDAEAFGTLVERYEGKLMRYGRRFLSQQEDIEDIVQDVFVSAYQNIRSFDPARRFSPWIYQIAHNAFVNALRKRSHSPFVSVDFDTLIAHHVEEAPANPDAEHREMRALIDRGLGELPPSAREILALYYLEEFSYKEIADILRVPQSTVGVRLMRAREALKKVYEKLNLRYE